MTERKGCGKNVNRGAEGVGLIPIQYYTSFFIIIPHLYNEDTDTVSIYQVQGSV